MLGLRTTIYKVPDIDKAKAWYAEAFNIEPYFDQPFYVGFNIGGFELGLQPEGSTIRERPDNVVSYWGVSNIQDEYDRLIYLGATEHVKPKNVGGEIIVSSIRDPWVNVVGLIYNPEFRFER